MSSVPTDAQLIAATQAGNTAAYAELFNRHQAAATRLARLLTKNRGNAEDLTSLAYTRTFDALYTGAGPEVGFRTYLLASLQCLQEDLVRAAGGDPTAETEPFDPHDLAALSVPAVEGAAGATAAGAFASLPERWQAVLWHTDVEGEGAAHVGLLLGLSPQGVEALAYRAREGLRQYYAKHHLDGAHPKRCRATIGRLGAYTRDNLTERERAQIRAHLEKCERCANLHDQLVAINDRLPALLGPAVLGSYSRGYLNATETESANWSAAFVRIRQVLSGSTRGIALAGAATAASVALVAWAAATFVDGTSVPHESNAVYADQRHGASGWTYPPGGAETLAPMANTATGTSPLEVGGRLAVERAWYAYGGVPRPGFGGSGPIPVPPPPPINDPGPGPSSPSEPGPTGGPTTQPTTTPTTTPTTKPSPGPTTNTPGPKPSPTDPDPSPTDPSPSPTDPDPSPTDPDPSPTDPDPSPTDPDPSPTDPDPSPTDPDPSPTDPDPSPTDPGPSPTDPEPSPTEPTSTCGPRGVAAADYTSATPQISRADQVGEGDQDVPADHPGAPTADCPSPSESPTDEPTEEPTQEPTEEPTESPSESPSPSEPAGWMRTGPQPIFVLAPGSP